MNSAHHNTPVLILAGGLGTRLSEETQNKPKPMVEIGDSPLLVHIMRSYYAHGFNDFVICAGYRSWEIKQFFINYQFRDSHLLIDHRTKVDESPQGFGPRSNQEKWRVRVIDTGLNTMTGGRVARALEAISIDKNLPFDDFALTYGDGVCDVDLSEEYRFHKAHKKIGTILGVRPLARFGELKVLPNGLVQKFEEKPQSAQGLINGGFFFFKREFQKYLTSTENLVLEREPVSRLAIDQQLAVFEHSGFWVPVDSLRDRNHLQSVYDSGDAPWLKKYSEMRKSK